MRTFVVGCLVLAGCSGERATVGPFDAGTDQGLADALDAADVDALDAPDDAPADATEDGDGWTNPLGSSCEHTSPDPCPTVQAPGESSIRMFCWSRHTSPDMYGTCTFGCALAGGPETCAWLGGVCVIDESSTTCAPAPGH